MILIFYYCKIIIIFKFNIEIILKVLILYFNKLTSLNQLINIFIQIKF